MDYTISFTDTSKASFVIKPYTTNGPKDPSAPTPLYNGAVSASTSLVLLGKGAFDYGEPIQRNFVHLLENFANKYRPSYPIQGQLWYKNADVGDPSWPGDPGTRGLYLYNGSTWTQIPTAGVPMSAQLDAGTFKIVNVADPVDPADALNLRTGDARYVNVSGDQMRGPLNMSSNRVTNVGDAQDAYDAINLNVADSRYLQVSGGQMMGGINMNNRPLTNVPDAVNPQDALSLRKAMNLFVTAAPGGAIDGGTY